MSAFSALMTGIHPELPLQTLSLGLCVVFALLIFFAWRVNYRSESLFPQPGLRLATLFLRFQILLIVINIVLAQTGTDLFPRNLWHLDLETSIPSINSTVQLFLLSSLCLAHRLRNRQGLLDGASVLVRPRPWPCHHDLFEFDVISKLIVFAKVGRAFRRNPGCGIPVHVLAQKR